MFRFRSRSRSSRRRSEFRSRNDGRRDGSACGRGDLRRANSDLRPRPTGDLTTGGRSPRSSFVACRPSSARHRSLVAGRPHPLPACRTSPVVPPPRVAGRARKSLGTVPRGGQWGLSPSVLLPGRQIARCGGFSYGKGQERRNGDTPRGGLRNPRTQRRLMRARQDVGGLA